MEIYLGMDPYMADYECRTTNEPHIRFSTLSDHYEHHLVAAADSEEAGNNLFMEYHRACALRYWFMFLVGTALFVDKSERYVDVTYLCYWGSDILVYLYQKLNEASN